MTTIKEKSSNKKRLPVSAVLILLSIIIALCYVGMYLVPNVVVRITESLHHEAVTATVIDVDYTGMRKLGIRVKIKYKYTDMTDGWTATLTGTETYLDDDDTIYYRPGDTITVYKTAPQEIRTRDEIWPLWFVGISFVFGLCAFVLAFKLFIFTLRNILK